MGESSPEPHQQMAAPVNELLKDYAGPQTPADEARPLFDFFDADDDGKVTRSEMIGTLEGCLEKSDWTEDLLDSIYNGCDKNGNGKFEFSEFWGWIMNHGKTNPK